VVHESVVILATTECGGSERPQRLEVSGWPSFPLLTQGQV
jgi:hypothetical protein